MTQADYDGGRPTQFHNVPTEERAMDGKGNKLPWALVWPDGHPNAFGQKRHVDDKGSFGKSSKRKGSSRTRTATPTKKENATLDGFEKAFNHDMLRHAESQQLTGVVKTQNENNTAIQQSLSNIKEPTQVILLGYPASAQWAALDYFERNSFGIICEDYDRQPPSELRKFPNTYSASPRAHTRPLTKIERALAFRYAGGNHWIKVTFDSAEAAERALENSPAQISGHWVYAQLYHGSGPQFDEAIPIREGEREAGRPLHTMSPTTGASFAPRGNPRPQGESTLLRPFSSSNPTRKGNARTCELGSPSSSTATSGTITEVAYPELRHRHSTGSESPSREFHTQQSHSPHMMRHFPNVPRTILRPAHEAFLPTPTWWERQVRWLAGFGVLPGEVIGDQIPLTQDGEFDWARASFYWRIFYWIDSHLGSDYCGLKEKE